MINTVAPEVGLLGALSLEEGLLLESVETFDAVRFQSNVTQTNFVEISFS